MIKKYYSRNEYFYVDPLTDNLVPYEGYVIIEDGIPYSFESHSKLIIGDNYITKTNLSDDQFDRLLDINLKLPNSEEDCTFAANDFMKSSVIKQIIKKLEENNNYLFRNCFVSQNNLPLATKIPVIAPYRASDNGEVSDWIWSNISYNDIQDIWDKTNWPSTVEGYDWDTDNVVDAIILPTDKPYKDGLPNLPENNLFVVFIIHKTKVQLMNVYLCPDDILSEGSDPLKTLPADKIAEEVAKRKFVQYSPDNNQISTNNNNLNLLSFSKIDPNNPQSIEFKNIVGGAIDKNILYIVDSELNGLFKYDISKCLSDRGAATNKISLVDNLQGFGTLDEPYLFNNPSAISAFNNYVAVLDKSNKAIKILDNFLNHKVTITAGSFVRQNAVTIKICPYDFILDGTLVKSGSIWVISEVSSKISIDIFSVTGEYIANKEINYIELIKDIWYDDNTGQPSSNEPIYNQEIIKKIEFSYNNSNYYYIITNRRIIKFQLSQLTYPIGITSYYYRSITIDNLVWENVYQEWSNVQDLGSKLINWEYRRSDELIVYPQNKCFAITGIPTLDNDIIFNILDNKIYYSNGKLQRVDNYTDNKLLYIDNISKKYTYSAFDSLLYGNLPVYVNVGSTVDSYVDKDGVPTKDNKQFVIRPIERTNDKTHNMIIFYKEPNILKSSLLKTDINIYSDEELNSINVNEYYSVLTLNKILNKLFFNLVQIKKYIYGTFVAGYSVDNIMTYDNVSPTTEIQNLASNYKDFYISENEQSSIVLNRCFINLHKVQLNILKLMQTKFISTLNYNLNTYKII